MTIRIAALSALTGSAALFALAAPAAAQTQVNPTFTGPRVEALVGYDINKAGSTVNTGTADDRSFEGVMYGGAIGYDLGIGGAVIGAEAELTGSTAKSERTLTGIENAGLGDVNAKRDLYVGARVGFLAQPDLLVYAKGGYTNARYDVNAGLGGTALSSRLNADGYRIGGGFEYALSGNSFAKLEYRYSNYSRAEVDFGRNTASDRFDIDLDRHQIVAGFGIRF
ncbi:porin family protein [Erythrobacteraceae bacterium CFH 75059]|uniref:outer membrane protein n=1 Tax=Qipengyuania thermophila TaxID=2509361 RepID=UPI00101FBA6F|nr:outer membrane beta-barrel protein [Qipengyuania thermophila]TCD05427.1 porin family protein [Erythrobacteraceae bacterium CFH 75059]